MKIIHRIPRTSVGWGGGICASPPGEGSRIYETAAKSSGGAGSILIKDTESGNIVGKISIPYENGCHDIDYDPKRGVFWVTLWGGPIMSITGSGTPVTNLGKPSKYLFGIFYDDIIDRLWVSDHVHGNILIVNPDTGKAEGKITIRHRLGPGFEGPTGLVRVEGGFFVSIAGEYGSNRGISYIVEINNNGVQSDNHPPFKMPYGSYAHDLGGLSFGKDGCLWAKGGRGTSIYKLSISSPPPPGPDPGPGPEPDPEPEPEPDPEDLTETIIDKIVEEFKRLLRRIFG